MGSKSIFLRNCDPLSKLNSVNCEIAKTAISQIANLLEIQIVLCSIATDTQKLDYCICDIVFFRNRNFATHFTTLFCRVKLTMRSVSLWKLFEIVRGTINHMNYSKQLSKIMVSRHKASRKY